MRGTKAKALRRIATNNGVLNRTFYKVLKSNKPLHQEPKAKPDKRRKPLPVAPRPGAKPMHLVRKLVELRSEVGWRTPKLEKIAFGVLDRHMVVSMVQALRDPKYQEAVRRAATPRVTEAAEIF